MLRTLRRRQLVLLMALSLTIPPSFAQAEPWKAIWLGGPGAALSAAGICRLLLEPGRLLRRRREIATYREYAKLLNAAIEKLPDDEHSRDITLHVDFNEKLVGELARLEDTAKSPRANEDRPDGQEAFAFENGPEDLRQSSPSSFSSAIGKDEGVARLDHERWPLTAYAYVGENWETPANMQLRLYVAPEVTRSRFIEANNGLYILFIAKTSFILNQWMDKVYADTTSLSAKLADWMREFRARNPEARAKASLIAGPSRWHADSGKGPAITLTGVIRITDAATPFEYAQANLYVLRQMSAWVGAKTNP